jgi:hypothetical protein
MRWCVSTSLRNSKASIAINARSLTYTQTLPPRNAKSQAHPKKSSGRSIFNNFAPNVSHTDRVGACRLCLAFAIAIAIAIAIAFLAVIPQGSASSSAFAVASRPPKLSSS